MHALIPAAGMGSRMGGEVPKQYLDLAGRSLLERTAAVLASVERIAQVLVVTAPDDARAAKLPFGRKVRCVASGGATRAASVRAGLDALQANDDDWVLVHDAARACLTRAEVDRLIDVLRDDPIGGLLAMPVADTLKLADDVGRVKYTVPRERMWRAATPQMFRVGLLRTALDAPGILARATDEASAIEALGHAPRLVEGRASNIKITTPDDLALARAILAGRAEQ
jgi:2-C-methyl-D-erythritol 4-phosphate cytidylyltransferase